MKNKGAYINLVNEGDDLKATVKSFEEVPHPNVRAMQYAGFSGLMWLVRRKIKLNDS